MVRIHVISKSTIWTQGELQPGSEVRCAFRTVTHCLLTNISQCWESLWEPFNGGPDWISEPQLAKEGLKTWRSRICNDPDLGSRAIIDLMSLTSEDNRFFSPFGRHLINDSLHSMAIFPGMPGRMVCDNDATFESFTTGLFAYLNQFETRTFEVKCCARSNSHNFLDFQSGADDYYSTAHIWVFRKAVVSVPVGLYNRMARAGLLDPHHIIGIWNFYRDYCYAPIND